VQAIDPAVVGWGPGEPLARQRIVIILVAADGTARARMAGDSGSSVRKDGESDPPIQGERRVSTPSRQWRDDFPQRGCPTGLARMRAAVPREPLIPGARLVDPALQGML
jgi:hypothetical protein